MTRVWFAVVATAVLILCALPVIVVIWWAVAQ